MKKRFLSILGVFFLTIAFANAQDETRLLRFPTIYGDQIVFSNAGDLYTVDANGGMARKLTSHNGYESFARFSPDGKLIAFTGQYDGNTEVFVIPAHGGTPKRLTFTATLGRDDMGDRMGPNNIVIGWTPDGKNILYRSRKITFNSFKGQLFTVPVEGGLSEQLPLSYGGFSSYSPDGKKLAFNWVFREFRTWKYYKGGMADDIRIFDFKSGKVEKITETDNQEIIPMWIGNKIYFLSDRDRRMNLFVYDLGTKTTSKLTNFEEYDIKFPSSNNNMIVFENGGYIYKFDPATNKSEKVKISIAEDTPYARTEIKDVSKNIASGDVSPNGERVILAARGDIFSLPVKSGITYNFTQTSGTHERNVEWSPDGKNIAYISDKSGEFEIYVQKQDGTEPAKQLTKDADTYIFSFKWSPDSKKILFHDRKMRLRYVDVATGEVSLVSTEKYTVPGDYDWSPDSKWIAFGSAPKNEFGIIKLYNLETKKFYDVTDSWYDSGDPEFSPDGKYLYFASNRDFNPTYSRTEWNHSYSDMSKIYLVTLAKDTPSPFASENVLVKIDEEDKDAKKDEKESKEDDKTTKIDTEGLGDRILSLDIKASNYFNLQSAVGKIYYVDFQQGSGVTAKFFDLEKKKETELGKNLNFSISANGKKMLVGSMGKWTVIDLPSAAVSITDPIDLSGLTVTLNHNEEWAQIFDESWRQMRDFFYVPNMHGVDWPAMKAKYGQLVPYVKHRDDLTYIIGEMIGELNVGHSYVNSGEKAMPERINVGLLGGDVSKHSSGYFKVDNILKGANWSSNLRSPLTEIGVGVSVGDYILAVNGNSTANMQDIYSSLVGQANKDVELTVNSKPSMDGSRKVIIKPLADESALYYYKWVQHNIDYVAEKTNGQIGYIHIPDMGPDGLNEFAKHFYPQLDKKGLIIDDRGNGGGNVSPMIIERLRRDLTRATMRRNFPDGSPVPEAQILGPKVLLIDRSSASDGDLFPYSFKQNKLGTVIGTRTWGGVVGISGSLPFLDGQDLRKPEFASYSGYKSEWIIEGFGVEPDIYLDNDPHQEFLGNDAQLDKAIAVILSQMDQYKEIAPVPAAPDKSK
ncbi:MAG: PDZ domain-containing protein [Bacteroidales bacterium]|nr:PDZ domain-containing protein [Bacteroidales bacterium]MCF8390952.1 PDZ domain-containing protein [Bacteroidales bacterium]